MESSVTLQESLSKDNTSIDYEQNNCSASLNLNEAYSGGYIHDFA